MLLRALVPPTFCHGKLIEAACADSGSAISLPKLRPGSIRPAGSQPATIADTAILHATRMLTCWLTRG